MRRTYLDQNKWIDLSRAHHNRPGGAKFKEAFDICLAGVERGLATFPLSVVRYIETYRRAEPESRMRLGKTMATLSQFHALAPQTLVLPWEIDVALATLTQRQPPPQPPIFGIGVAHAFGVDTVGLTLPNGTKLPPGFRSALQRGYSELLEHMMLYGPHDSMPEDWHAKVRANTFGQEYADFESGLSARAVAEKFAHGQKLERVVMATEMNDILRPLSEGLARAGVSVDDFMSLSRDEMTQVILSMPTRNVTYHLRLARHKNRQKDWERNDLNDVTALAGAVPYCDVVVTEKSWAHELRQAKLDREYGTTILSETADLATTLITP